MKSIKLALLALLIPSASLPMERVKNALKKTAPAAAAVVTVGFLGYKAAQAYGINPWQTAKDWLHSDCQQEASDAQARRDKALQDLRALYEAELKSKAAATSALEKQLSDADSKNAQLQEQLRAKEVTQAQAAHNARTTLPVSVDLLQSIPSASAAERARAEEDRVALYTKALRADAVNMASIFEIAKRSFTDELSALMPHNSRYDRIKEIINSSQFATQAFLREFTQSDVNFEKSETVQRAHTILARHQFQIDEIAKNLGDLEIALINNIRANNNFIKRNFINPENDAQYIAFRSFIDSFHSRQNQCHTHEVYRPS